MIPLAVKVDMLTQREPISKTRKAILRSVYLDNLRMAGTFSDAARQQRRGLLHKRIRRTLLVGLLVAWFLLPGFGPSLSLDRDLPPAPLLVASEAIRIPQPASHPERASSEIKREAAFGYDLLDLLSSGNPDYRLMLSGNDQVRLSTLFGLNVKTIVVDPGHGGKDPGAVGAKGIQEKNITLSVAQKLKERLLRRGNYRLLLTRENDSTLSLAKRVQFAKENRADLFISIHVNSLPNQNLNVIETYYFGPPMTSELLTLAEQENKESHFTIGEIDSIIQDIGNTLKRQESARLAASIQESLFRNVRHHDGQVRNVGIKSAPFVVLSKVEVPSVLVEISCLTNETEENKLSSSEYRDKVASFMEEGIAAYLEIQHANMAEGEKEHG